MAMSPSPGFFRQTIAGELFSPIKALRKKPSGHWVERRPEHAREILSPSTRQKDLVAKRERHAANGVPYYLIRDPEDRSALLLSLDADGTYCELPPEDPSEIHSVCAVQLEVAPLFA